MRIIDPQTGSMKLGSYAGQLQQNEVYSGGKYHKQIYSIDLAND